METQVNDLKLKYPVGRFQSPETITKEHIHAWIKDIEEMPEKLKKAIAGLNDKQLDVPYREGGWTSRQVVHHLADSNMNAYIRFKLALTEEHPLIKPYNESLWAELPDSHLPIEPSLEIIDGLHRRWVALLKSMDGKQFLRTIKHPELGTVVLDKYTGLYAWHARHHVAHITELRERMGW